MLLSCGADVMYIVHYVHGVLVNSIYLVIQFHDIIVLS